MLKTTGQEKLRKKLEMSKEIYCRHIWDRTKEQMIKRCVYCHSVWKIDAYEPETIIGKIIS